MSLLLYLVYNSDKNKQYIFMSLFIYLFIICVVVSVAGHESLHHWMVWVRTTLPYV